MESRNSLRQFGPKVFLSYSFRDEDLARRLRAFLTDKGFVVRMEDETSLINHRLSDVLPKRVGDAEVFIQLRTADANRSRWVDEELKYAEGQRASRTNFVLLPIVFDRETLVGPVTEWVYIDASTSQLDDQILGLVERQSLTAVQPLPLDEDNPFELRQDAVERILSTELTDNRRIILDSGGILFDWMDDILTNIENSDAQHRKPWLAQERRHRHRLEERIKVWDQVALKLAHELRLQFGDYRLEFPKRAVEAFQRFARMVLGREVLHCAQQAPPDHAQLKLRYRDTISAVEAAVARNQAKRPSLSEFGTIGWALGKRPVDQCDDFVEVGLDAIQDRDGVQIFMPKSAFGTLPGEDRKSAWSIFLQIGESPSAVFLPWDWGDFALPQIAVRAARNIESTATAPDELENRFAWRLSEYHRMGHP